AGKTTLLRMVTGLLAPSDGSIRVLGKDPRRHPEVYKDLALVPEEDAVYGFLTGREYVEYAAILAGAPASLAGDAIAAVELEDAQHRPINGYSKGMRQRAKVAAALVAEPKVLVLDEPLNGTDPVQRAHLISAFRDLAARGHTVIVSSHVLAEVERMADRVLAIVDGKLAAAGDVSAIRGAMSDIPYRVRINTDLPRELAASLMALDGTAGVTFEKGALLVETTDLPSLGGDLPGIARSLDARVTQFEPEDESLESVFRYLVRRK
ncbi:MAG: ABC transporter ATP-binding protein, partial [Acidimicrobiia bacterium]|nr:ABC transporter ATP-binding protein [Acidimicrobiia bacterium]